MSVKDIPSIENRVMPTMLPVLGPIDDGPPDPPVERFIYLRTSNDGSKYTRAQDTSVFFRPL